MPADVQGTPARWWVSRVAAWLVLMAGIAVLAAMVVVPRIAGATPYTVLTGSMQPTYPPGTLVVTKPADVDDIGVGSVITYQLESGEQTVVTHRVVAINLGSDDSVRFITQGDANNLADDPVRPEQIRGEVWYDVPYLGHLNNAFTGRQHQLLVTAVAGGLGIYAFAMFGGAIRDRLRTRRNPDRQTAEAAR